MDNPKLQGIVRRFADGRKIAGDFDDQYQIFANYLLLKQEYFKINEEYPFESFLDATLLGNINFGKNSSMAIDGCFAIKDKDVIHLDMEEKELDDILNEIADGTLHIVLIQTKSGNLDPKDLSTLSACMNATFTGQAEWQKFISFRKKCNELLTRTEKVNLSFTVFYVSGNALEESLRTNPTFQVREDDLKQAMKKFFWINNDDLMSIKYYGDKEIYSIYDQQSLNAQRVTATVEIEDMTNVIDCGAVGKVRFGAITFGELMKILYNQELQRPNELYVYNVRDAIKDSPINQQIEESIKIRGDRFLLLNNGITMIVDNEERRGDKGILLENIRIVNGCQTCHAILNSCKSTSSFNSSKVPIKIIKTDKDDILNAITFSSNNQNVVSKANKFAIQPQMFDLEKAYRDFQIMYNSKQLTVPLLERRQGQYNNQSVVYIDMLAQAKAYLALWKRKPHFVTMYADKSLDEYRELMSNDDNFICKSLIAGVFWNNVYQQIPPLYENARYHIFAAVILHELELFFGEQNIMNVTEETYDTLVAQLKEDWSLRKIDLGKEINLVVNTILQLNDRFPPTASGKIHYRKFYPVDTLKTIYDKYKEPHISES